MEDSTPSKTSISLAKLPKGFYYILTRREVRKIIEKVNEFGGFINSIRFDGISSDEQKTTGKVLHNIHLKYGISCSDVEYDKNYCSMSLYGFRETSIPSSKVSPETKIQIQDDIVAWLKKLFSQPESAPDTRHRLLIRLSRKEDGSVAYLSSTIEKSR